MNKLVDKSTNSKPLPLCGLFTRAHLFLLNAKTYDKLALEQINAGTDSSRLVLLVSKAIFESDRLLKLVI